MNYYVIVFDPPNGKLVLGPEAFTEPHRAEALARRFELEREMPGFEVVVLGAESEDAIRRTHGRYFKSLEELGAMLESAGRRAG